MNQVASPETSNVGCLWYVVSHFAYCHLLLYKDNYYEEAFKMRNLLEEFHRSHSGHRKPSILGLREHIFTGRSALWPCFKYQLNELLFFLETCNLWLETKITLNETFKLTGESPLFVLLSHLTCKITWSSFGLGCGLNTGLPCFAWEILIKRPGLQQGTNSIPIGPKSL